MTEIEEWIDDAIKNLDFSATKLLPNDAMLLRNTLMSRFLSGRPQMWWWNALKVPYIVYNKSETSLDSVLPTLEGQGLFIPDTQDSQQPVYVLPLNVIDRLLDECPLFEYAVSNQNLDWMVIENHHDELFLAMAATGS